jgi:hypothetical protein
MATTQNGTYLQHAQAAEKASDRASVTGKNSDHLVAAAAHTAAAHAASVSGRSEPHHEQAARQHNAYAQHMVGGVVPKDKMPAVRAAAAGKAYEPFSGHKTGLGSRPAHLSTGGEAPKTHPGHVEHHPAVAKDGKEHAHPVHQAAQMGTRHVGVGDHKQAFRASSAMAKESSSRNREHGGLSRMVGHGVVHAAGPKVQAAHANIEFAKEQGRGHMGHSAVRHSGADQTGPRGGHYTIGPGGTKVYGHK